VPAPAPALRGGRPRPTAAADHARGRARVGALRHGRVRGGREPALDRVAEQRAIVVSAPFVHPTAIVEDGVRIGADSAIWDHVHLRRNATIGRGCIVGEKTYVAYDVVIGDLVKINACVYVCAGVTIEDGCMIAAHVVFTNDRTPRATDAEVTR